MRTLVKILIGVLGADMQESPPIFQGSYSPFEKTMLDAAEKSMPPREMTDQSASPLIPKRFLQSACILFSSYSPAYNHNTPFIPSETCYVISAALWCIAAPMVSRTGHWP